MNSYEQHLKDEIDALRAKLDTQTVQMGSALECIRQLVELAIDKGHKRDSATRGAQRFLAEMGVQS